jgi:hypothetical protein
MHSRLFSLLYKRNIHELLNKYMHLWNFNFELLQCKSKHGYVHPINWKIKYNFIIQYRHELSLYIYIDMLYDTNDMKVMYSKVAPQDVLLLNSVFVICKIIKVSVSVISLAFGSAYNAYLDLDNSAYHKNLIQ